MAPPTHFHRLAIPALLTGSLLLLAGCQSSRTADQSCLLALQGQCVATNSMGDAAMLDAMAKAKTSLTEQEARECQSFLSDQTTLWWNYQNYVSCAERMRLTRAEQRAYELEKAVKP